MHYSTTSSGDATGSICPKGWYLPKVDSSGDFQTLYNKYKPASGWSTVNSINGKWLGAASASAGGAFFSAAGYVGFEGLLDAGSGGVYWSRTAGSSDYAYGLYFSNSSIDPFDYSLKNNGYSVRCVAYSS